MRGLRLCVRCSKQVKLCFALVAYHVAAATATATTDDDDGSVPCLAGIYYHDCTYVLVCSYSFSHASLLFSSEYELFEDDKQFYIVTDIYKVRKDGSNAFGILLFVC